MTDEEKIDQEKLENEKIEKEYERLLKTFLFGRLGITKESYKKFEKSRYSCFIFENSKEHFVCSLIHYLTHLSEAMIFLEVKENQLNGIDLYCDLRDSFQDVMSSASYPFLTKKEEKEISGILSDIFNKHLSVSYKLRKKNHEIVRRENEKFSQ